MSDFNYLNVSNCYEIDGVNDESEFDLTRQAMKTIGMGGKEQEAIFTFVAAILHIGNIKFKEEKRGSEGVKVADQSLVDYIASLLKIDGEALSFALTHRHIMYEFALYFILCLALAMKKWMLLIMIYRLLWLGMLLLSQCMPNYLIG